MDEPEQGALLGLRDVDRMRRAADVHDDAHRGRAPSEGPEGRICVEQHTVSDPAAGRTGRGRARRQQARVCAARDGLGLLLGPERSRAARRRHDHGPEHPCPREGIARPRDGALVRSRSKLCAHRRPRLLLGKRSDTARRELVPRRFQRARRRAGRGIVPEETLPAWHHSGARAGRAVVAPRNITPTARSYAGARTTAVSPVLPRARRAAARCPRPSRSIERDAPSARGSSLSAGTAQSRSTDSRFEPAH